MLVCSHAETQLQTPNLKFTDSIFCLFECAVQLPSRNVQFSGCLSNALTPESAFCNFSLCWYSVCSHIVFLISSFFFIHTSFFKKLLDILRSVFPYFFVTSLENWWEKQPPLPVCADWRGKCSLALGCSLGFGPGWRPYVFLGLWRARVLSGTVHTQISASVSWFS